MQDVLQETKNRMTQVIEHLKVEFKNIRTGRASPGIIEGVSIEVYGTQMRLKEVATISVPEPRQLLVTPFDKQNVQSCARAIEKANLGVTSVVEGSSIRVLFPELDAKRRADLIQQAHKKREDGKIHIRNIRRDMNELLKKQKSDGKLPEDEHKRQEEQVQKLTDKFCKEADDLTVQKEKDISSI